MMGSNCSVASRTTNSGVVQSNSPTAASSSTSSNAHIDAPIHDFDSCIRTVVQKTKFVGRHRWVIEGFSTLPIQRTVSVTSPPFVAGGRSWEMFLHNDGHSEAYGGCISVFLQLTNAQQQGPVTTGFRFYLVHPTDDTKKIVKPSTGQKVHVFKAGDSNWGFYELVKYNRLAAEKYLHANDALVVEIELEISIGHNVQHEQTSPNYMPTASTASHIAYMSQPLFNTTPCSCTIRRDISELLNKKSKSDVVLMVGPDQVAFQAHKAILCARSNVFRAMFASVMADANESTIPVPDASPEAIRALLNYVYSDSVPENSLTSFAVALEVFQLADRFDLDRLTELIVPIITRYLSSANILSALQFAEAHRHCAGGIRLRRCALEYARIHFEDCLDEAAVMLFQLQQKTEQSIVTQTSNDYDKSFDVGTTNTKSPAKRAAFLSINTAEESDANEMSIESPAIAGSSSAAATSAASSPAPGHSATTVRTSTLYSPGPAQHLHTDRRNMNMGGALDLENNGSAHDSSGSGSAAKASISTGQIGSRIFESTSSSLLHASPGAPAPRQLPTYPSR